MPDIKIDDALCTQCERCLDDCVRRVFAKGAGGGVFVAEESECLRCGHCVAICSMGAISHAGIGPAGFDQIDRPMSLDPARLRTFLRSRRSIRSYLDRPVSRPLIEELIEVARFAPSASNRQNVAFTVIDDRSTIRRLSDLTVEFLERIVRLLAELDGWERLIAAVGVQEATGLRGGVDTYRRFAARYRAGEDCILWDAPAVLLAHSDTGTYSRDNCLFATYNFMLAATARGLGSCVVGLVTNACRNDKRVTDLIGLPPGHQVYVSLPFGYPAYEYYRLVPRNPIATTWI